MSVRAGFHGTVGQPTAQVIGGSLKFQDDNSAYLSRTPSSAGNRKTWTFSCWVKRSEIGSIYPALLSAGSASGDTGFFQITFESDEFSAFMRHSSGTNYYYTNALLRDISSWYHLVVAMDTTQSAEADRLKMYINGVEPTYRNKSVPSQDQTFLVNNTSLHQIGATKNIGGTTSLFLPGYLSNVYLIDGQALNASYFGFTDPLTNTWRPKKYEGTFGTNGFYLPMDNQDDFEKDKSGNGNDFTKGGFTGTSSNPDVVKDSPSGVAFGGPPTSGITTTSSAPANYCTFNTLDKYSGITLSNGNLTLDHSSGSTLPFSRSTIGMSSGKFYFEVTRGSGTYGTMGIATVDSDLSMYAGRDSNAVGGYEIYTENTEKWAGGSGGSSSGYLTVPWDSDGDVASCYFDADNGTIGFKVNGTDMGIAFTGINTSKTYYFQCGSQGTILHANWGQKPFKYAPPEGYLPLNSATVRPETVIVRPDQYVGLTTYRGNVTARKIDMGPLAPDLVWIKSRPSSYHILTDSVRGVGKQMYSNSADTDASNSDRLTSFDPDGFSLAANTSSGGVNTDNYAYIAWAWRAGGSKFTYNKDGGGGSSATDIGVSATTLTLTGASINTTSKFGIYAYTGSGSGGASINHGLGGTPGLVIYKKRTGSTSSWQVYHQSLGGTKYMNLDEATDEYTSDSTRFGGTDPTSTTITLGTHANSAHNVIVYAWCDVPGLQKFGKYTGNGSTDGPFIELGFKPAVLIYKRTDSDQPWYIIDVKRDKINVAYHLISPDSNAAEETGSSPVIDLLSNGFKPRASYATINANGGTYIYMAWAEAPASNLFGGQSNAR